MFAMLRGRDSSYRYSNNMSKEFTSNSDWPKSHAAQIRNVGHHNGEPLHCARTSRYFSTKFSYEDPQY